MCEAQIVPGTAASELGDQLRGRGGGIGRGKAVMIPQPVRLKKTFSLTPIPAVRSDVDSVSWSSHSFLNLHVAA